MPGGRIEEGESDLEAMEREFIEETGRRFLASGSMKEGEGTVFTGRLGEEVGIGEMDWCSFDRLPSCLSFPKVEYIPMIDWARDQLHAASANNV